MSTRELEIKQEPSIRILLNARILAMSGRYNEIYLSAKQDMAQLGNSTTFQPHTTIAMAQGKVIPKVVHWIIIHLSTTMLAEDIAMYADVSLRSVKKILLYFKQTGDINVPKWLKPQLHHTLCDYDIQVCKVSSLLALLCC